MQKKIELKPLAELGRGYALIDEKSVEIRVSGIMGALKVWLIGENNVSIGNITGGKLIREIDTEGFYAVLITQSGRQMFYGEWDTGTKSNARDADVPEQKIAPENPYAPLPDLNWEKITGRDYPTADERVRFALSNNAFFANFKKYGHYLFARDGERYAVAIKYESGDPAPFPCIEGAEKAGDYIFVRV